MNAAVLFCPPKLGAHLWCSCSSDICSSDTASVGPLDYPSAFSISGPTVYFTLTKGARVTSFNLNFWRDQCGFQSMLWVSDHRQGFRFVFTLPHFTSIFLFQPPSLLTLGPVHTQQQQTNMDYILITHNGALSNFNNKPFVSYLLILLLWSHSA